MITVAVVEQARAALLGGALAIVPTDTVYGLAAALDSPAGVDALYTLKGRPRTQPCQVLVYAETLFDRCVASLDPAIADAARLLLPGQATCIVPDPSGRFAEASGGGDSVGIRYPAMTGPIAELDIALVATSANEPGGRDPSGVDLIEERLRTAVDLVLDLGPLPGTASAVVDLRPVAQGEAAILIRPGPDPEGVVRALRAGGIALSCSPRS